MNVELNQIERDVLAQLVDAALREIGPEIRRTMTYDYKDDLKKHRETLRHIHERLTADNPEVFVGGIQIHLACEADRSRQGGLMRFYPKPGMPPAIIPHGRERLAAEA